MAAASSSDTVYLVDGSGYIFRAFHALPPLSRPDGTPVGAVLGFTNMLSKLLTDIKPGALAVIFDAKRANFRNDIYPEYKANRDEPPPDLRPQFALIREATEAFCLPSIEVEGYEADDLIATYARLAQEQGRRVTIVSSDKDLMQLVTDSVDMLDPIKNQRIGPEQVVEKFGVAPDKVVEVQALAGDSVDNVPGVPGIGIKTAAQLIAEYGDLETLLARAGEIKQPKRRETLQTHAEQARISRKLVQLDAHAPVPRDLDSLTLPHPDPQKLLDFLLEQGFRTTAARLQEKGELPASAALGSAARAETKVPGALAAAPVLPPPGEIAADPIRAPAPEAVNYTIVTAPDDLRRWVEAARETGRVAVTAFTAGGNACTTGLAGIALAPTPGLACYIPLGHKDPARWGQATDALALEPEAVPEQLALEEVVDILGPLLGDPAVLKIGHTLKADLQVLAGAGMLLRPADDVLLLSYCLEGGRSEHEVEPLALRLLEAELPAANTVLGTGRNARSFDFVALDKAGPYAAQRADMLLRLWFALKPRLAREGVTRIYEQVERPLVPVIADMEAGGITVDRAFLAELSQDLGTRIAGIEADLHRLAGRSFNIGSPKQLGEVLFGEMGLPGGAKSKTGAYSTAQDVLEPLAEQGHEVAQRVLDWRQLSKLKSTYTDALQQAIDPQTGRVHTFFNMAGAATGRLASTEPNLQNIPIRTEEGRKIRRAFIAAPGHKLISVDYSQVELRLVAEIAGIESLAQAFRDDADIHALTASQVFGVPLAQMTSDIRAKAKAINFGIIYGISGFGLARQLGITPAEAGSFIRAYLDRFHELERWMEATKQFCRQYGYVRTAFGRKVHVPGIAAKIPSQRQGAERQAINAPIQGTAADIMKQAMLRVPAALRAAGMQTRLLLQVHDELVLEAPEAEAAEAAELVRVTMEGAAKLSIPLNAEAGIGDNWGEAH